MNSKTHNPTEIVEVISDIIESDPTFGQYVCNRENIHVVIDDIADDFDSSRRIRDWADRQSHVVIHAWPESGHFCLVSFRALDWHQTGIPLSMEKLDVAIDWIADVSIQSASHVVVPLVGTDQDEPIYYAHSFVHHGNRVFNQVNLDIADLGIRFPRVVERILDSVVFVGAVLLSGPDGR